MVQKQRPQERKLKLSLQQNIFVMFFLFRTCGCGKNVNSEEETVVAILQSLMEKSYRVWWKKSYRAWWKNLTWPEGSIKVVKKLTTGRKKLGEQKRLQNRLNQRTTQKVVSSFWAGSFWVATFLFWKKWIGSGWRPPRSRQRRPTSREKAGSSSRKMMETALACLSSWPQVNF